MKKSLLFAVSALVLAFASCDKGGDLAVSIDVEFGYDGGTKPVNVAATDGLAWNVEVVEEWVTFEKSAEGFVITAAANLTANARQAKLTVTAEGVDDVIITVRQTGRPAFEESMTWAKGTYWGPYPNSGYGCYQLGVYNEFVEDIGDGWIGYDDGAVLITVFLFGAEPDNLGAIEIPAGTYTIRLFEEGEKEVIENFTAMGNLVFKGVAGFENEKEIPFVDGQTFKVERDGNNYVITFDNVLLKNGVLFSAKYSGFVGVQHGLYPTALTGDVNFAEISGPGSRIFRGDAAENGTYRWGNVMCNGSLEMTPDLMISGNGFFLDFNLLASQTDAQHIPAGTYTISSSMESGTASNVNYIEVSDGYITGRSTMYKGKIVITRNGDDYRAEFDMEDVAGHSVKGAWEGKYGFVDGSETLYNVKSNSLNTNHLWKAPEMGLGKKVKQMPYFIK